MGILAADHLLLHSLQLTLRTWEAGEPFGNFINESILWNHMATPRWLQGGLSKSWPYLTSTSGWFVGGNLLVFHGKPWWFEHGNLMLCRQCHPPSFPWSVWGLMSRDSELNSSVLSLKKIPLMVRGALKFPWKPTLLLVPDKCFCNGKRTRTDKKNIFFTEWEVFFRKYKSVHFGSKSKCVYVCKSL